MLQLLGNDISARREATAECVQCRDVFPRSAVTFLGDAKDAGTWPGSKEDTKRPPQVARDAKMDLIPTALTINGFEMTQVNRHLTVAESSTLRAGHRALSDAELRRYTREEWAFLPTLEADLVKNHHSSERKLGTKIAALLREIAEMQDKNESSKCCVFSQFLGVLDIAQEELTARGIEYVRIDEKSKQHERADALLAFEENKNVKVCLLSMRSCAVGLNLQVADHCFLMDVAHNPASEQQAIDRVHRSPAKETRKSIVVKRFVMEDTIEERLLTGRGTLGADTASNQAAGTQVSAIDGEHLRQAKRTRADADDSASRQKRLELLEIMYGGSSAITESE